MGLSMSSGSTIAILVRLWRQMGLKVSFVNGPSLFGDIDAAAVINHVDLTVTPAPYLAYLKRFSTVINGGLVDISKSKYCRDLLASEDDYDGPVIIKTNLNYGGIKEYELSRRGWRGTRSRYLGFFLRRLRGRAARENFYWDTIDHLNLYISDI